MRKLLQCTLLALALLTITHATPTGRIVGGNDAHKEQFPYQVSVRLFGVHVCGGSIISEDFILTAAHCVVDEENAVRDVSDITVRVGSIQRTSGGKVKAVEQIIVHDNNEKRINDIALVKVQKSLVYTDLIAPIPIASSSLKTGVEVLVSGWGDLETYGELSNTLQWVTLKSLSSKSCATYTGEKTDALLCLAHDVGKGICNADAGGPAVYKGQLVGVSDFVIGDCGASVTDGFVDVYYHRKWIKKNANL